MSEKGRPLVDVLAEMDGNPVRRHTPRRSMRIGEALWRAAQIKAAENGETVTDVVVRSLERYVKR